MMKRMLSAVLALVMVISMIPAAAAEEQQNQSPEIWDGSIAKEYGGGSGTEGDPYLISNGAQLARLSRDTSKTGKYYLLTNNIYLNDTSDYEKWETSAPANTWVPVGGSGGKSAQWEFDGNGYIIYGVYMNNPNANNRGLFSTVSYGTIRNLSLKDAYICGGDSTGGIAGSIGGSVVIENCCFDGTVIGKNNVGGIVGYNSYNEIYRYCCNHGVIKGDTNVGGIYGGMYAYVEIDYSYNTGSVTGNTNVGGICGQLLDSQWNSRMGNCYNTGEIKATSTCAGGLVGYFHHDRIMSRCYNVGTVTCEQNPGKAGALVGYCGVFTSIINCYYLDTSAKQIIGDGFGSGKTTGKSTTAQMMAETHYSGFDFNTVWYFDFKGDYNYPQLVFPNHPKATGSISIVDAVKAYTMDTANFVSYCNTLPPEEKFAVLQEYFSMRGIADVQEGIAYLADKEKRSQDYEMLLDNNLYLAYLYSANLGPAERAVLTASDLLLGGEINQWIDVTTYVEWDYPGIAKYKAMLLDYMETSSAVIERVNTVKNLQEAFSGAMKYTGDALKIAIVSDLERCTKMGMTNEAVEGVFDKYGIVLEPADKTLKLSEDSGFGRFIKGLGTTAKALTCVGVGMKDFAALLNMDNALAIYQQHNDFLQEIVDAKDYFPWEMRVAAQRIIRDMERAQEGAFFKLCYDLALEAAKTGGLQTSSIKILANKYGAASTAGGLADVLTVINTTAWLTDMYIGIGDTLDKSDYVDAYRYLTSFYRVKLIEATEAFLANMTEDNAWEFYQCYERLRNLRYKAEETYIEMCYFDGFWGDELNILTGFSRKEDAAKRNFERLNDCKFTQLPVTCDTVNQEYYKHKTVISSSADVGVYDLDGNKIVTLTDGRETDITNNYGRFICMYNPARGVHSKILYFKETSGYTVKVWPRGTNRLSRMESYTAGADTVQYLYDVPVAEESAVKMSINDGVESVVVETPEGNTEITAEMRCAAGCTDENADGACDHCGSGDISKDHTVGELNYIGNGDGTHMLLGYCTICEKLAYVHHSLCTDEDTDGACDLCGDSMSLVEEIVKFAISGCAPNLNSVLELGIGIPKANLPAGMSLTAIVTQTSGGEVVKTFEIPQEEWINYSSANYMVYVKMAAKCMADDFSIEVVDRYGRVWNEPYTTSFRKYVSNVFSKGTGEAIKPLLVDMLNYGAAAQKRFNYNVEDLANKDLTAEQQAYSLAGTVTLDNKQILGSKNLGSTVSLESRILVYSVFKGLEDVENMYAVVEYTDVHGRDINVTIPGTDFELFNAAQKAYKICVNTLVPADIDITYTMTVYNADGSVFDTAVEGLGSYLTRNIAKDSVFGATINFGMAAKQFFAG